MAKITSRYTEAERARIAEIGRAAELMGLRQEDAARRATEVLGVNVSQSSVSRCILADPIVQMAAEEVPDTLFDFANLTAAEAIEKRLDVIIELLQKMHELNQ